MNLKSRPCGAYMTNCYIIEIDGKNIIIDPGIDAYEWVINSVKNPIAILNTHGHFDHIWSNADLKKELDIPIYAPKEDIFMIESDPFEQGTPVCSVDYGVNGDEDIKIDGIEVKFIHYPGHTPGCSAIIIEDKFFSGDFIFKDSIGRVDFPFSNPKDMKRSIEKFLNLKNNYEVYPGHGDKTTVFEEQQTLPNWLRYI